MRRVFSQCWLKLCCLMTVVFACGCDYEPVVTPTAPIPFQPSNPYFYGVQAPFDMVRAWIDFFLGPFS